MLKIFYSWNEVESSKCDGTLFFGLPANTTLRTYEKKWLEYIERTSDEVSGSMKEWIDRTLSYMPARGYVLEIGSGSGRDAKYMETKGFRVLRTDATKAFLQYMGAEALNMRVLDVLRDRLLESFDMIFANAVFLHFTPDELSLILEKAQKALGHNGILAFSVKEGEGSEWSYEKLNAPRFYQYWDTESLSSRVREASFSVADLVAIDGWIYVIATTAPS